MHQTPRVFISYSHDSDEHREWVARLSERLRSDGIATNLDAYVNGTPAEGWPRWMLDQLDEADRVLLICTETYYRRFRGHEAPGRGRGVDWEGAVISQEIYDARSKTTRFIPVLRTLEDERYIPEPVRGQSRYCLTDEQPYQDLYKALLGRAGYEPGPVGEPKPQKRPRVKPLTFGSAYGKDQGEDRSESLSSGRSKPDAPLDQTRTSADQSPVDLGIDGLEVVEHQIGEGGQLQQDLAWRLAAGVQGRVQAVGGLRGDEEVLDERRLEQRLAAGHRQSAAARQERLVPPGLLDHPANRGPLTQAHRLGVGVVAVQAPQRAPGEEHRVPQAGAVDPGGRLRGVHEPDARAIGDVVVHLPSS